jgi:hypothetical protein
MPAPYHNLLSKCDRALVAYVVSLGGGAGTAADVFPAKRSQDRPLPCSICYCEKGEETASYSGTYTIQGSVQVRSEAPADAGEDEAQKPVDSDARVAATFDGFHVDIDSSGDKLADDITKAARALAIKDPAHYGDLADFTVQNILIKGIEAGFEQGSIAWTDSINFELVACPANVDDPA